MPTKHGQLPIIVHHQPNFAIFQLYIIFTRTGTISLTLCSCLVLLNFIIITDFSYVKPRTNCSIDRIYTEIVPNSTVYSPQTIQPIAFHTEKIRHVNDLSMNWNTAPMLEDLSYKDNNRHREDSGVHTAHNRYVVLTRREALNSNGSDLCSLFSKTN